MFTNSVLSEEATPAQVVAKSWKLYRQAENEKEDVVVTVEYKDGRKDEKQLTRWIKYDPSGEDKVMIKFSKPAIDEGLGLLIWRHPDKGDDVWLKLPSLSQERRISVADQTKYFAETDFTYEDSRQLIGERIKDFVYRFLEHKDGVRVIEAVPKPGAETGYGKRVLHINPQWVFLKAEYYGKNGGLLKIQTNSQIDLGEGGRWRIKQTEVDNFLLKRKTIMVVTDRKIDTNLSAEVFSRKFLTSTR
jgi:hypothetical protein